MLYIYYIYILYLYIHIVYMNIYIYVCSYGFRIIFHCFWGISGVQTFFAGAFATVPGPGAEGGDQ
jgi:hypothetical protein